MKFTAIRGARYGNTRRVELPWGELTGNEQHNVKRKATLRTMGATIVLASLAAAWANSGDYGTSLPTSEAGQKMREEVAAKYLEMSTREKYEATYIDPIEYKADYIIGATGLRGVLHYIDDDEYEYRFGQGCLAGSAYDTSPLRTRYGADGNADTVASLSTRGDKILVHPAGTDAAPLVFESRGGELFPDSNTRATLLDNDCRVADGLVVRVSGSEEGRLSSDSFNHRLHPSEY